ncbi:hypothetical protein H4Q32_024589 [Labeo rohita]|uniref:Uncharacterized protein n=1 Tax=Labeo rohita TaxID=84645 RepID=A0ABQ8L5V0_LABRO|nr:hypothetical protein H4Q32_024589 [Labeo rohita]
MRDRPLGPRRDTTGISKQTQVASELSGRICWRCPTENVGAEKGPTGRESHYGKSQSKLTKYDTPLFDKMEKGSTNPFDVFIFPHVPPPYHHYPVAELQALKVDPDLNCSPPRRQTAPPARPSALPARPAVPSAIPTAPHPQAAAAGGQEEEEDPKMIPKSPNEEADAEKTHRLPPSKKRKTRNTVKEENVSITAPMVKVSRPDGVMMVFRPWTVTVAELAKAIKVAFPVRVDTSRIGNCCQTREESVQEYYYRLYETFNKHSEKKSPTTEEINLAPGSATCEAAHALHAEEQQMTKKERAKAKTDKELQLALVQPVSRPGEGAVNADCVKTMVTGSENVQKTSKIKKQTEARKTESREEGSGANSRQLQLREARDQAWCEVGRFVKKSVHATDWCEIGGGMKHSKSLGAFVSDCKYDIEHLAQEGHKVSLPELQTLITNYAILEQPLRALTIGKGLKSSDQIEWTEEAAEAFVNIKVQLSLEPTLGLAHNGDRLRPVAYFSSKLDPVAAGLPQCLRAVASAEKAVMASKEFVGYSDLTLMVPHAVSMILQEQKTSHLSTARWLRYHTVLLDTPNITVKRCTTLNPATLLPTEEDGEEHHCCLTALDQVCMPHPDLLDTPLENCENVLFVDDSAFRDPQTVTEGLTHVRNAITVFIPLSRLTDSECDDLG